MEHQAYVRRELLEVQSQKRKAEARLKTRRGPKRAARRHRPRRSREADINRWIDQDPSIASLIAKLAARRRAIELGDAPISEGRSETRRRTRR